MRRHFRPLRLLLALPALLCALAPAAARDQKTVFHGLAVEPDTGFLRSHEVKPISLEPAWVFEGFTAPLAGDPVATGKRLVAADTAGRIVAIEVETGAPAWTVETGEPLAIGPSLAGPVILQGTSAGRLLALSREDGAERWRVDLGGPLRAAPIDAEGILLAVTATPEALAIDRADGRIRSRLALPGAPLAPARHGTGLVIGTDTGRIVSIGGDPLAILWDRDLGHPITGPPLADDDERIFVATEDRALWSLRARSGRPRWRQRIGSRVTARPIVVADLLYVPCWDNDLYVLGRKNGHVIGRARLGHRLSGETAMQGTHLFVAPATEASVVGLALPYLGVAGRHELGVPGEWFTTSPVASEWLPGVAIGWGRSTGRLVALRVDAAPESAPGTPPDRPPAAPATSPVVH